MRRGDWWGKAAAVLAAGCLSIIGCALPAGLDPFGGRLQALEEHVVDGEGSAKILSIDVSGLITAQERSEAFGLRRRESSVARVVEELDRAAEDESIKALLLRINSPGGTVTASDILYREIRSYAEEQRVPVVAQLMDVGASGGYYVALAADEIIAHPTSVTGSIGVVMASLNLEGLMQKIGVRDQTLKAGRYKDIGSPLRAMKDDERRILQGVLDDMQARFEELVRERRPGMSDEALKRATDGRIFTAPQALATGLIDGLGYLDDAVARARSRAGLEEARVVLYRRPSEFSENIYSAATAPPAQINLVHFDLGNLPYTPSQFLYLWTPGIY